MFDKTIPRKSLEYELMLARVQPPLDLTTLEHFHKTVALTRIDRARTILTHREKRSTQGWIIPYDAAEIINVLEKLEPLNIALEAKHRIEHADAYTLFEESLEKARVWSFRSSSPSLVGSLTFSLPPQALLHTFQMYLTRTVCMCGTNPSCTSSYSFVSCTAGYLWEKRGHNTSDNDDKRVLRIHP